MNASSHKSAPLTPARDGASTPVTAVDNRGSNRRGLSSEAFTFIVLLGLIAAMILLSPLVSPSLGGLDQIGAILILSSFLIVVAFGQQMVVLVGGLDLSVASTMTLGGILAFSWMSDSSAALVWTIPVILALTACVGALNGLGVTMLKVPPFIMTLAMGIVVYSVCLGYTGGTPRGQASPYLAQLFSTRIGGVAPILILMFVLIVAASLLQARTAFGRKLYAIGTSPVAAFMAGLKVKRLTIATYAISGAAAGLAGILMVGYAGGATLVMGQPYLMPSIAAIIVGGTSILGGRGIYPNAVAGAVLLTTFSTIISALQIAEAWRTIIYGLLILIAIMALRDEIYMWAGRFKSGSR